MSYNGSGVAVINSTGQPVSANTLIEASVFNAFTADVATMLSTCVTKDGQTTVTANLPMAGYKLTGLGAGSAAGNSVRYEQVFSTGSVKASMVKGADVASAAALTLGTDGNYFDITGTTAITSIGTLGVGTVIKLHFDDILTLTHHSTDLILPGAANITTAAGDEAEFVEYATGDWRCTSYSLSSYSGSSLVGWKQSGTGAVTRTAQDKLRESVSVLDFGAVGDDSDETAELAAAFLAASGGTLMLDRGCTYRSTASLVVPANTTLELNGSTIKFVTTGSAKNLDLRSGTTVRNGTVENAGSGFAGSGDSQCPILIGDYGVGTGYGNIVLENLDIKTARPGGNGIMITGDSRNITLRNINYPDSAYLMTGLLIHWGGANDPTSGTFHPYNIEASNLKFGAMTYATASDAGQVLVSGGYNVTVDGVEIEDAHNAGVYLYCGDYGFNYAPATVAPFANHGLRVSNVAIRSTDKHGVYIKGDCTGPITQYEIPAILTNVTSVGNDTDDGHGFYSYKAGGTTFIECEASSHHNGMYAPAVAGVYSDNIRVYGGKYHDNDTAAGTSYGIMLEDGTGGHIVRGAKCYLNKNAGIYDDSDNSILDANILGIGADTQLYGIRVGPNASMSTVTNNFCREAVTAGFGMANATSYGKVRKFDGNTCHSDVTTPYAGVDPVPVSVGMGQIKIMHGTGAPASGTWLAGDTVFDTTPNAGFIQGWVCTVAGTPGTWEEFGTVGGIAALGNSATPSVTGKHTMTTGGTTTITNFSGGVVGQHLTILSGHAVTITDGTNIFLAGSANFVMKDTDTLSLVQKADGKWYEIGRSVN